MIYDESVLAEDLESILDMVQSADVSFASFDFCMTCSYFLLTLIGLNFARLNFAKLREIADTRN